MRRVDAPTLRKVAEHYLGRHSSTRANLVRMLERRAANHARKNCVEPPEGLAEMIAEVVETMVALGFVDDRRLAESKSRSMRARGKSARAVRVTLRQKGVAAEMVDSVLANERDQNFAESTPSAIELEAARALVRRKKLGAMRESRSREQDQKDLAVVARAGFSFDIARRALAEPEGIDEESGGHF